MNTDSVVENGEEDIDLTDGGFGVELSFFVDREAVVAFIKEICSANWEVSFLFFSFLFFHPLPPFVFLQSSSQSSSLSSSYSSYPHLITPLSF